MKNKKSITTPTQKYIATQQCKVIEYYNFIRIYINLIYSSALKLYNAHTVQQSPDGWKSQNCTSKVLMIAGMSEKTRKKY